MDMMAVTHADHTIDHDSTDHDHGGDGGGDSGHVMMMFFHFSNHATILFEGWHTMNAGELAGSCVAVFVMAALYEGLKVGREKLLRKASITINTAVKPANSDSTLVSEKYQQNMSAAHRMFSCAHLIQALLHIVQVVVSYFLMLIFMTYNGWLCISVAVGAGMGYFLFSWNRNSVQDINEHCH